MNHALFFGLICSVALNIFLIYKFFFKGINQTDFDRVQQEKAELDIKLKLYAKEFGDLDKIREEKSAKVKNLSGSDSLDRFARGKG